ncbi:MAG: DUF418 domain-containing protein [Desulfobulbaceae bacterium]|nr:DUF418 domain-containing protein [Desulfobulbaceae bacterium]
MVRESVSSGLNSSPENLPPSILVEPSVHSNVSRINGYDAARGVAILGMIVVNYFCIFRSSLRGDLPFKAAADFLSGRAATLFVILAGIGLTLMARKPMLINNAETWMQFHGQIIRRSVILFFMGIIFSQIWTSDILHFYCLFLIVGLFCLQLSTRLFVMIIAFIWLISTGLYTSSTGALIVDTLDFLPNYLLELFDDLFINGQYAFFPWFCFLLTGIWFGHSVMKNPKQQIYIFIAACLIFLVSESIMMLPSWLKLRLNNETAVWVMLENNPFPPSPFFVLSAGSMALMVICCAMMTCRLKYMAWLINSLKNIGRMSLTIYIGHILIGKAAEVVLKENCTPAYYPLAVTLFMVAFVISLCFFCSFWFTCFKYGPLEWLMRKSSTSLPSRPILSNSASRPE